MNDKGVYHCFIANKLKERTDHTTNVLKRKEIKQVLSIHSVPKVFHCKFLKEMEGYGLIKVKDKQNIEILL